MVVRLRTAALLALCACLAGGCVKRTIRITSDPSGALVWLNDREVGRTPVDVEFVHYGTYDVRLVKEGFEALQTSGDARPPWWDNLGLDLVAEVLPAEFESEIAWHFEMEPKETDVVRLRSGLTDRALEARERLRSE